MENKSTPPESAVISSAIRDSAQRDATVAVDSPHLRTDHLRQSLGRRAVSGGFLMAGAQAFKLLLNVTGVVILARLLSPQEFGLVAMAGAITANLGLLKGAGLSIGSVQRETVNHQQVSNVFWANLGLGVLLAVISIGLAWPVAWFYGDDRLTSIMLALSLTFVFAGATAQHQALLLRQMRLKARALIGVVAVLASVVVGCSMAWVGFGYWALVGMPLCLSGTAMVMTWSVSRWCPALPSRRSGVRSLLRFGIRLTTSDLIVRVARSTDTLLIGRFFGAASLGLYSRADALLSRPLEQVIMPMGDVFVPLLSRLQFDPERYRRTFLRAFGMLALISFPFTASLFALSKPLILVLLGPGWVDAAPILAVFTVMALCRVLWVATWLLITQGRGREYLRLSVTASALTVAAVFAGLPWGVLGVAVAISSTSLLIQLPLLYYMVGRSGPVSTTDLWRCFLDYLPVWVVVAAATAFTLVLVEDARPIMQLMVSAPVGLLAGGVSVLGLRRPRESVLNLISTVKTLWEKQEGASG